MKANLGGKVAFVVGGSKGIGKAIALKFAENGADVMICTRTPAPSMEAVKEIEEFGVRGGWEPADFVRYAEVRRAIDNTVERFGKIDILVASGNPRNSGESGLFHQLPAEEFPRILEVMMLARIYPIRAVVEHMIERKFGKIIIVTSDAGLVPTPSESLIGASAAGLMFLTRQLGRELSRHGIRINAISTTLTKDTPGWDRHVASQDAASTEVLHRAFNKIESRAAFGLNHARDLAELALYLAADESNQMSGRVISINGGLSFP